MPSQNLGYSVGFAVKSTASSERYERVKQRRKRKITPKQDEKEHNELPEVNETEDFQQNQNETPELNSEQADRSQVSDTDAGQADAPQVSGTDVEVRSLMEQLRISREENDNLKKDIEFLKAEVLDLKKNKRKKLTDL